MQDSEVGVLGFGLTGKIHLTNQDPLTKDKKVIPMILDAEYVSEWEEGDVYTNCKINAQTGELFDIESVDTEYEFFESERVDISINGATYQLDADDGELTEAGIKTLKSIMQKNSI